MHSSPQKEEFDKLEQQHMLYHDEVQKMKKMFS